MNSDIEDIKSKLNIVDVLGDYIRLEKAGSSWRANCPFHNEKTPSFMVSEEKQMWHCFGCQKGGDVFSFVMEIEGLEFREALKMLAEKAGVELKSYNPQKIQEKNRTLEILDLARKWYQFELQKNPKNKNIVQYLRERGLQDETITHFGLGYAPVGWRNIVSFLKKRGYEISEIARTGLLVEKKDFENSQEKNQLEKNDEADFYDRFRQRIMFPIGDYFGKTIGFSARVAPGGDEAQAKYVNTPETEVYHKSQVLYGIDKAKNFMKKMDWALLVEGNMDVIACHQLGLKNAIAVSGTALTSEQLGILKRYTKNIKMFFDMDSAGEKATKKSVKLCLAQDMAVKIVILPSGKDAADLARENPQELKKAIAEARPFMEYFFQKSLNRFDKETAEGKKKISEEILEMVGSFESDVEKNHWIKKLSEEIEISEEALTNTLKKANLKNKIERFETSEEKTFVSKSMSEMLLEEILALMLVSKEVWKKAFQENREILLEFKDSLLNVLLEKGERLNFDLEVFRLEISSERELSQRLEKIYLQKKYRLDLNNNPEELSGEEAVGDFDICLKRIKIDKNKKNLEKITKDLETAKKNKDRGAIDFLSQELSRITQEQSEIMNQS